MFSIGMDGEIGRHTGLKILRAVSSCGFDSRSVHNSLINNIKENIYIFCSCAGSSIRVT